MQSKGDSCRQYDSVDCRSSTCMQCFRRGFACQVHMASGREGACMLAYPQCPISKNLSARMNLLCLCSNGGEEWGSLTRWSFCSRGWLCMVSAESTILVSCAAAIRCTHSMCRQAPCWLWSADPFAFWSTARCSCQAHETPRAATPNAAPAVQGIQEPALVPAGCLSVMSHSKVHRM